MSARPQRRGFTLIEVLAALTITALVTTIAGSALRAGLDVRDRVMTSRTSVEAESRVRSWLTDMVRHAANPSTVDGALFQISSRVSSQNMPSDAMSLMSVGVEPPYGSSLLWRVTVNVEPDGLHVRATPQGRDNIRATIETVLPHIAGLRVEALEDGGMGSMPVWRADWPLLRTMPSAVRMTLITRDGAQGAPLVIETRPLERGVQ